MGVWTNAEADADALEELLMIMFLSFCIKSSTCFPHLGQITQSLSICSPQHLQYFFSFSDIVFSPYM
jgi:hypothetical protein